eukprot:g6326.t1
MNTTCTSSCSSYFSAARCVASCGNDTVPVDGNSLIPSYCKCALANGGPTVTRVQRYDQNITVEIANVSSTSPSSYQLYLVGSKITSYSVSSAQNTAIILSTTQYKCAYTAQGKSAKGTKTVFADATYVSPTLIKCPWKKSLDPAFNKIKLGVQFYENNKDYPTLDTENSRYAFNDQLIYFVGTINSVVPSKGQNTGGSDVKVYGTSFVVDGELEAFSCIWAGVENMFLQRYMTRTQVLEIHPEYIVCQTPPWRYKLDRVKELTSDEGKAFLSIERNGNIPLFGTLTFQFSSDLGGIIRVDRENYYSFFDQQ